MVQCVSITHTTHRCHNSAKYGEFCGVHRVDKPISTNICHGTTKCGERCRKVVKRGQFCNTHMFPEEPDHDWAELVLYKPDVNWPDMKRVLYQVSKQRNGKELDSFIRNQDRDFGQTDSIFGFSIPLTPEQKIYQNNTHLIVQMQTFFVNYYIDISSEHWQNIIKDLCNKSENVSFLKEYRALFRRKFDNSFREETKKNYIEIVLTHSPLGKDITKKIMNFI